MALMLMAKRQVFLGWSIAWSQVIGNLKTSSVPTFTGASGVLGEICQKFLHITSFVRTVTFPIQRIASMDKCIKDWTFRVC